MSAPLKRRLDRLAHTRDTQSLYPDARAELLRRLERADPETRERVFRAIRAINEARE